MPGNHASKIDRLLERVLDIFEEADKDCTEREKLHRHERFVSAARAAVAPRASSSKLLHKQATRASGHGL